jgi:DUF4097 and DUF4098 domain-containing protein YvlB
LGLVPLLLATAGSAGCFADIFGSGERSATAEERFEYALERVNEARFRLFGKSGNVTVTAVSSDSIIIHAVLRVTASSSEAARAGLSEFWVDVDESSSEIVVQTAQPSALDTRSFVIDYEITVPPFMLLSILNVSGNITVGGIGSDVFIQNTSGKIELNNTFGPVRVQTRNGSVDAQVAVPLGGHVLISTGNGDIDLAIPVTTSADMLATTANGQVTISNLEFESAFQTPSVVSGRLGEGLGFISAASENGNVAVVGY